MRQNINFEQIRENLPKPQERMTCNRKAAILQAIQHGILREREAIAIYRLSEEELDGWTADYRQYGVSGLKVTTLHRRRQEREKALMQQ